MPPSLLDGQITFIYVRDLIRSADFYEQKLGFLLWRDQVTCRIYHVTGQAYIGICQVSSHSKGQISDSPSLIITLVTDDVENWYDALQAKGIQFEHPPQINEKYNIFHCFLRDPDGYLIEIQRFLSLPD